MVKESINFNTINQNSQGIRSTVVLENFGIKDTPHSELRFKTELNQKTSSSGHNNLLHMTESTNTVRPVMQTETSMGFSQGTNITYKYFAIIIIKNFRTVSKLLLGKKKKY